MPRSKKHAWRKILMADPCVYCYGAAETIDHIHPQIKGGKGGWMNSAPACKRCNGSKGDSGLLMYLLGQDDRRARMRVKERLGIEAMQPNCHFAEALRAALNI